MNRIYMTFLTEDDVYKYSWLKESKKFGDAKSSAFAGNAYNSYYYVSDTAIVNKNDTLDKNNCHLDITIRPVIKSSASLIPFIERYRTNNGDLSSIELGTYPLKEIKNVSSKKLTETGKVRNVLILSKVFSLKEYTDGVRKFIISPDDTVIEILPLEWEYNVTTNSIICKSNICRCTGFSTNINNILIAYNYMNTYFFKEMLDNYETLSDNRLKLVGPSIDTSFEYPYINFMEVSDDNGKVYIHSTYYELTIPKGIKNICSNAFKNIIESDSSKLDLNVEIDGIDLILRNRAFYLNDSRIDAIINNLIVHNKLLKVKQGAFNLKFPINNITMPCDFMLFSRLYLSGDSVAKNIFENSNLTLNYNDEKELVNFINDVYRFFSLIYKDFERNDNKNFYLFGEPRALDFTYKNAVYKHEDAAGCVPNNNLLANKEILSILKVNAFTLKGPKISDELISKLFPNFSVKKEFIDLEQKKDTQKQIEDSKDKEGKPKLSKEAEHILDLAREIMSIDYIGLDKEDVRKKVDTIVIEYNNGLLRKNTGLSLSTNNGVYTNTIIKLETLKDSLYHNFEKNMEYYDILDLISSMIKKLNNEETDLHYEILKDLDTLNDILKYSKDEQTKNELISYLENERQSIIDYLCGKKEIDYKNIDEFVKKFRLYLVPILTRVSGDISKIDVMEQIKDYALDSMNDKTTENTNNYIKLILSEIDKIKKSIVELDSEYTFEELDYSSFKTGKEILDYLDKKYMEYYRVYLDLVENKVNEENYENSKVPLIY